MKKIPLTQGQFALVDDCDYEDLIQHKWLAHKNYLGKFYPERGVKNGNKPKQRQTWRLYWSILGKPEKGFCIDHIDGNPLNNLRNNLRVCTNGQNQANRGPRGKTGFKGAVLHYYNGNPNKPMYRATIRLNGTTKHLGYYKTPQEAQAIYFETAKKVHGEFASI